MALISGEKSTFCVDRLNRRTAIILKADPWSMEVMAVVRDLGLPDWAIGAGFVRSLIWDKLSNKTDRTALPDLDVIYFDPADVSKKAERCARKRLNERIPGLNWSVKNQARMHLRNADQAYLDTNDALRFWLETPTAVAARLEKGGEVTVLAPLGLDDLFDFVVRPTDAGIRKIDQYRERVRIKSWSNNWPQLSIMGMD
jgi:uncharacterized protein